MKDKLIKNPTPPPLAGWSTMEQDLSLARTILTRHHDLDENGEQPSIYLQEATIFLEGSVEIKQADWVVELGETYEARYGVKKGDEILRRVLTAFLTSGNTVH